MKQAAFSFARVEGYALSAQLLQRPATREAASLAEYAALFVPDLSAPLHYKVPGADLWPTLPRGVQPRDALAAHVLSGALNEPQELGRKAIEAVGARGVAGASYRFVSLDLDDRDIAPAVLRAVSERVGVVPIVTSSSLNGLKHGRFRAYWHVRSTPLAELEAQWRAVVAAAGFPHTLGSVEAVPRKQNDRLPFGLGACVQFNAHDLTAIGVRHPLVLARGVLDLPALDLREAAPNARTGTIPERESEAPKPRPKRRVGKRVHNAEGWAVLRGGVRPGMRHADLVAAFKALADEGLGVDAITLRLRDVDLRKSNADAREQEYTRATMHKRVAWLWQRYKPAPGYVPIRKLSVGELQRLRDVALRVELQAPDLPFRHVYRGLRAVLPFFKALNGRDRRLHRDTWVALLGSGYVRVREHSGLFVQTAKHRRGESAKRWRCTFQFDPEPPTPKRRTTADRLAAFKASDPTPKRRKGEPCPK